MPQKSYFQWLHIPAIETLVTIDCFSPFIMQLECHFSYMSHAQRCPIVSAVLIHRSLFSRRTGI